MFKRNTNRSKSIVLRAVTLVFTIIFTVLSTLTAPMSVLAVGELENLQQRGDVDLTAYTFDELCAKEVYFPKDFNSLMTGDSIQRAIYYNCKSSQEYYKWLDDAIEAVEPLNSDENTKDSAAYRFKPEPKGIHNTTLSENKKTEAWARYNTVSNKMTRIMARGQGEKLVGDVFGQEFDPTNAVTLAAMNTFTMICNVIFNTVAKALMLLFLVQTGFDVLYLVIPALQPILAPANANSGGGGAGLAQGKKFGIRFNVVSNEAVEANNRGATGSVGSNGGTGGGIFQTNIALRYLTARAPLILIAFTYFVLVATNVWTDIISACTSLITGIFYGL